MSQTWCQVLGVMVLPWPLLGAGQESSQVKTALEMILDQGHHQKIVKQVVTFDKSMVHHYQPETKQQEPQRKHLTSVSFVYD